MTILKSLSDWNQIYDQFADANQQQERRALDRKFEPERRRLANERGLLGNERLRMQNQLMPEETAMRREEMDIKRKYLPLMYQAKIKEAERRVAGGGYRSGVGKMIEDYQAIVKQFGPKSQEAREMEKAIKARSAGHRGLRISSTPEGGFVLEQGGVVFKKNPDGTTDPSSTGTLSKDGELVVAPTSSGSKYSRGGDVLTSTKTGESVSVATKSEATRLQRAILGDKGVLPILEKTFNDLKPLIGLTRLPERGLDHIKRQMGMSTPELDRYNSAIQTELPLIGDQMLGSMGLNNTTENRVAVTNAVKPTMWDTKASYARRVSDALAGLLVREKIAKDALARGINLTAPQEASIVQDISDKMYQKLLPPKKRQNSSVVMTAPDGTVGEIPLDKVKAAQEAGFIQGVAQ